MTKTELSIDILRILRNGNKALSPKHGEVLELVRNCKHGRLYEQWETYVLPTLKRVWAKETWGGKPLTDWGEWKDYSDETLFASWVRQLNWTPSDYS
jgi:hypothetical protein